ncbi:MAG: DUF378 domain-containing protein [Candidatus Paceibacterota bacterium]
MKILHLIAFILVIVGGLNWLLVGAFGLDLVDYLLGTIPLVAKTVYILVGLSAVYLLLTHRRDCQHCQVDNRPDTAVTL